jgi:hypothetical protein
VKSIHGLGCIRGRRNMVKNDIFSQLSLCLASARMPIKYADYVLTRALW